MKPVLLLFLAVLSLIPNAYTTAAYQSVTERTTRSADNVQIGYDVRGRGPALVLIHGWASDRTVWREQVDLFSRSHTVITLDLGGHGASGVNRKSWTIASLAQDVEAVVKSAGLRRTVLIGHSMGGPVALLAAARMPDIVVGVIGVDTLHNAEVRMPEEQIKQILASFESDFSGTMSQGLRAMFSDKTDPALVTRVAERAQKTDKRAALPLLRDLYEMDLKPAFSAVKKPVRCVNAGPWEPWGPPTLVETNRKYANFDAVVIQGVRHFPMLERPAEFNKHLQEILQRDFSSK